MEENQERNASVFPTSSSKMSDGWLDGLHGKTAGKLPCRKLLQQMERCRNLDDIKNQKGRASSRSKLSNYE
ncbi:unnamed protein product [Dovyalis caffra]|uniref:Uncharacterized protein n=1 Tax=Dovyalis caffra TaxID=77055 RepID=A0AAV1RWU3_9ROSI|nr:unnamed protein product [Dovyalis caffra]